MIFFWQLNLVIGIILPTIYSIFIITHKKWKSMKASIFIAFVYYILFPIAGIRSCWQILKAPYHWDKTPHGISKIFEDENEI
jgi:glycosyltransferase XagB